MVAVHGRREAADHPGQRLDRHLDAGAEATRLGEQHPVDVHDVRLPRGHQRRRPARHVPAGAAGSLDEPCRCPSSSRRARFAGGRAPACGRRRGDAAQRSGAARHHRVAVSSSTKPSSTSTSARWQRRAVDRDRQARRRAARRRGLERGVRPGAHVRQPLRVLLHLPAAEGPAPQPVPEGRRLPAELPVRELHHAHPLHRGRPRAGGHRAPVAAERQHPRHRSRRAQSRCCRTRAAA